VKGTHERRNLACVGVPDGRPPVRRQDVEHADLGLRREPELLAAGAERELGAVRLVGQLGRPGDHWDLCKPPHTRTQTNGREPKIARNGVVRVQGVASGAAKGEGGSEVSPGRLVGRLRAVEPPPGQITTHGKGQGHPVDDARDTHGGRCDRRPWAGLGSGGALGEVVDGGETTGSTGSTASSSSVCRSGSRQDRVAISTGCSPVSKKGCPSCSVP